MINSGGEKVCSAEVESVLYWNPVVNKAAVVAKPDKFWGAMPCTFVCLKSAGLDCSVPSEKAIMEFCRERLPHFLAPKTGGVHGGAAQVVHRTDVRVTRNCHVYGLSRL